MHPVPETGALYAQAAAAYRAIEADLRSRADLAAGPVYFHVLNHGFSTDDTARLDHLAELRDIGVTGAVFRLGNRVSVGAALSDIDTSATSRGLRTSVHLRVAGDNPALRHETHSHTCKRIAAAMKAAEGLRSTRLFCDTLSDNDRGYFVRQGAIDCSGNPNPLLDTIRIAHSRLRR